ncbi:hypothetical protein GCM10023340_27280 [Nocardioides marinquilinus]|uniref:DUF6752 domain-containing protein n=1 Tax=Nocardioides marinquilinus TaxID=1210400 RepID=A0ABP9PWS3_9ACTN
MGKLKDVAGSVRRRAGDAASADLRRRVAELEEEMQEARALNVRVAELTDLVTELLVPLAQRDEEKLQALLARYHEGV